MSLDACHDLILATFSSKASTKWVQMPSTKAGSDKLAFTLITPVNNASSVDIDPGFVCLENEKIFSITSADMSAQGPPQ